MSDGDSFLARWSRLKRRMTIERRAAPPAATERPAPPAPAADTAPAIAPGPVQRAGQPAVAAEARAADDERVDLSQLPPVESLGRDSDYSVFMRKGVPDDLRMKALRRMWLTDPALAGPDVLDMYAYDYTGNDGFKPLVQPVAQAVAAAAKAIADPQTKPHHEKTAVAEPPAAPHKPKGDQEPADAAGKPARDRRSSEAEG